MAPASTTPASTPAPATPTLTTRGILHTWWPLASSWLLMGVEMPMIAALMSQLPNSEPHLAALGGIVFPLALMVEAPIIMMLAASTALCRDDASFRRLRSFMVRSGLVLTLLHALIAFTPLFDVLARDVIGAPEPTIEPARTGFRIMLLWTWAIADRRFHQGLLIRFGRQRHVGIGTVVRLVGTALPVVVGAVRPYASPIVIGTLGFATGVVLELVYARWCARPVRRILLATTPESQPLTTRRLWRFYLPLAMTPVIALLSQPIGAAGITRMPESLASLAVWPALNGLGFMLRSIGVAFNEVVVRHAGDPNGRVALGRFAWGAGLALVLLIVVLAATPFALWWFDDVNDLPSDYAQIAATALWWTAVMPLMSFLHSYYQGLLVHAQRTRGITEAVGVFLVVTTLALAAGVAWHPLPGAAYAMLAMTLGGIAQTVWLARRCAQVRRAPRAEY